MNAFQNGAHESEITRVGSATADTGYRQDSNTIAQDREGVNDENGHANEQLDLGQENRKNLTITSSSLMKRKLHETGIENEGPQRKRSSTVHERNAFTGACQPAVPPGTMKSKDILGAVRIPLLPKHFLHEPQR